ncbi:DUF2252 domain-containing protein [Chitinibacter tainanensis]|uniref:DUF2252 domain-containing protein n=1 Tax=Chitinibacter tainanensis TaxID=230667 RepID=UPI0023560F50|nr:DUF2252 domain-containing protein [Chitinibacter tainanensis]
MSNHPAFDAKYAAGRALRDTTARGSHHHPGNLERDPVQLLKQSSQGRVQRLVPLRYGRMLTSPFAFYRGSAIIQAHDLAGTPHSGIYQQICGDCHLMNFGGFATPERNLIFDLNDFDETHPGPWEWDVKRLAASFALAADHIGCHQDKMDDIVYAGIRSYQSHLAVYAELPALSLWYEKISFADLREDATDPDAATLLDGLIAKAGKRTNELLLPKMSQKQQGRWIMNDNPPNLFHIHGDNRLFDEDDNWLSLGNWHTLADGLIESYRTTLSYSHQQLLGYFYPQDMAFKVVGVGSVGTRCLVLLLADDCDNPLFLQIKEAVPSVLAQFSPSPACSFTHQGQRVVTGQRVMQAASDYFLGWGTGPFGRHFYFRQLRDMKVAVELETLDGDLLQHYARLCGRALARSHARAGGQGAQISGYLGRNDRFASALVDYAQSYRAQVERDYQQFRSACQRGELPAQTEADFGADFRL